MLCVSSLDVMRLDLCRPEGCIVAPRLLPLLRLLLQDELEFRMILYCSVKSKSQR